MSAMQCVELAQSAETYRKFSIEYIAWVEIKLNLAEVMQKFTLGNFIVPGEFPVGNRQFLSDFSSGLRYANQAFREMHLRIALEDFNRAIGSEWDECIYHCHHCLEAIRDYFGEGDNGWEKMRTSLDVEENVLRQVTDFSNDFIRHGINKAKLQSITPQEKSLKAGTCHGICHAILDKFSAYLNGIGVPLSTVKVITQSKQS